MDKAGRLIVGSVGQVENGAYGRHERWAQRTIKRSFPQVGETHLEYAWNGRIAMTVDHIPRFHILDQDMVTVTSYKGRGIGRGSVFGKLLAQYAMGGSAKDIPLPIKKPRGFSCAACGACSTKPAHVPTTWCSAGCSEPRHGMVASLIFRELPVNGERR